MTTATAHDAHVAPRAGALRLTTLAGLLAGSALIVDTVTIAVVNRSFGVLDEVLFFVGLIGIFVTLGGLATALSARATGARRVAIGGGAFVGAFVIIATIGELMDTMGKSVFSPANKGLHEEWFFFTVGVCLLLIAGWANRTKA